MSQTVVLFRGSYRFKSGDPLPELLAIMRTVGGAKVPEDLRQRIVARVRQNSILEKRDQPGYVLRSTEGKQLGPKGFFAQGFFFAVNWEQVAPLQHLWAAHSARLSVGPIAYQNTRAGTPQRLRWDFPPAACTWARDRFGEKCRVALQGFLQHPGRLLYYVQAVDLPHQHAYKDRRDVYTQALAVPNMTVTCGLMSVFVFFFGMRMKLLKKLMAPELVQECPGECVGVAFHEEESFGWGRAKNARSGPPPDHPCWQKGHVLLDRLPLYVEMRVDGSAEDYTGLEKPGVWHLEPGSDEWTLNYKLHYTVSHPRSTPKRLKKTNALDVRITRCQIPAAPKRVGTFQNMQGKIERGPDKEPLGHTVDLRKPDYFTDGEYKRHLYMILGRATSLDYCLFDNFPMDEDGLPEWHWFEGGPPEYLVHFLQELERRAVTSRPTIEAARNNLCIFPPWCQVPDAFKRCDADVDFAYAREAWDHARLSGPCDRSGRHSEAGLATAPFPKRILGKRKASEVVASPPLDSCNVSKPAAQDVPMSSLPKRRCVDEQRGADSGLEVKGSKLRQNAETTASEPPLPPPAVGPGDRSTAWSSRAPPTSLPKQPSPQAPGLLSPPLHQLRRGDVISSLYAFVRRAMGCSIHVRDAGGGGRLLVSKHCGCLARALRQIQRCARLAC